MSSQRGEETEKRIREISFFGGRERSKDRAVHDARHLATTCSQAVFAADFTSSSPPCVRVVVASADRRAARPRACRARQRRHVQGDFSVTVRRPELNRQPSAGHHRFRP